MKATLVNYFDVWGNKKHGWEVNNLCKEFEDEPITDEDLTDKGLLALLKRKHFLKQGTRLNQLRFDWAGPEMCEIEQRKDGYPIGRIELTENPA